MSYETITYQVDNNVATITLNSPPLNIITIAMMVEIKDAIHRCVKDKPAVLKFTGAGEKAFSAGVEISEHTPELVETMLTTFHEIFRALTTAQEQSGLVTVAQVKGHCLGGGCELACFCDIVIATEEAKFGTPEIHLGCFPPVAAALFPSMIGRKQAERLMFRGEIVGAEEALQIGLITDVVPSVEFAARARAIVGSISCKSSAVLALLRKSEPNWRTEFLRQLEIAEYVYLRELTQLDDMQEGINAYQEKRPPKWKSQ